jgi:hypothetical protein
MGESGIEAIIVPFQRNKDASARLTPEFSCKQVGQPQAVPVSRFRSPDPACKGMFIELDLVDSAHPLTRSVPEAREKAKRCAYGIDSAPPRDDRQVPRAVIQCRDPDDIRSGRQRRQHEPAK